MCSLYAVHNKYYYKFFLNDMLRQLCHQKCDVAVLTDNTVINLLLKLVLFRHGMLNNKVTNNSSKIINHIT